MMEDRLFQLNLLVRHTKMNVLQKPETRALPFVTSTAGGAQTRTWSDVGWCAVVKIGWRSILYKLDIVSFMIGYNYDAELEVSDTCVRSSLLSWVELSWVEHKRRNEFSHIHIQTSTLGAREGSPPPIHIPGYATDAPDLWSHPGQPSRHVDACQLGVSVSILLRVPTATIVACWCSEVGVFVCCTWTTVTLLSIMHRRHLTLYSDVYIGRVGL